MRRSFLSLLVLTPLLVFGQARKSIVYIKQPHSFTEPARSFIPASADTIRILAVRTQFLPDNDPRTTGTGLFNLDSITNFRLDPPPHDRLFFEGKLRFIKNYFERVSHGNLQIQTYLIDSVINLKKPMSEYSPAKNGSSDFRLVNLAMDTWRSVDSLFPFFDFTPFDMFIVFHAGVGRDIDLISLLGYDPTPGDIPSLYMSLKTMQTFKQDPSFQGIPVKNGGFILKNSLIFPSTLTRIFESIVGNDTLRLSTNGLLAASVGSHLGLPDLFDTRTGRSGIGQFGLMDGAGIFAYSGLFPPYPSAWERMKLGWLTPIELVTSTPMVKVPAVSLDSDSVYMVRINPKEYLLIENRNRDARNDGQTLTIRIGASEFKRHFQSDTSGFNTEDVSLISGNVIGVEDYDWATAGFMSNDNAFTGSGILIWHIDEKIIEEEISRNAINASIKRKGVRLLEADGSQDIGRRYEFLTPGDGTQNGFPLDAWFQGNIAPKYLNELSGKTYPSSNANSGASSLITLRNFSTKSPRMTFDLILGSAFTEKVHGFPYPARVAGDVSLVADGKFLVASGGDSLFVFHTGGAPAVPDSRGYAHPSGGKGGFVVRSFDADSVFIAGVSGNKAEMMTLSNPVNGIFTVSRTSAYSISDNFTTPPVLIGPHQQMRILIGTANGSIIAMKKDDPTIQWTATIPGDSIKAIIYQGDPASPFQPDSVVTITNKRVSGFGAYPWEYILPGNFVPGPVAGAKEFFPDDANVILIANTFDQTVHGFDLSAKRIRFSSKPLGDFVEHIAVADLDSDGRKEVVTLGKSSVIALNQSGVLRSGFPVKHLNDLTGRSNLLIAKLGAGIEQKIMYVDGAGILTVVSASHGIINSFAVSLLDGVATECALINVSDTLSIAGISASSGIQVLKFLNNGFNENSIPWGQVRATANGTLFERSAPGNEAPTGSFMEKSNVYNYPNPVYERTTYIRFLISDNASIAVTIFDMAGFKVAELKGAAIAGIEGELPWDVSGIGSGIYYAQVTATGGGKSESAIIKIAVVK